MKKILNIRIFVVTALILVVLGSSFIVSSVPDEIILFSGEKLELSGMFTAEARTDSANVLRDGTFDYSDKSYFADIKFFGVPVKTVKVDVIDAPKLVPCGNSIGVKLYTDGLMVVGVSNFPSDDGSIVSPAKTAGVKKGDIIHSVNGVAVNSSAKFTSQVESQGGGAVNISLTRNGNAMEYAITPCRDSTGKFKLGIWVRSSVAGIGTMTFYNPSNGTYGALGHGIADGDTGMMVPISRGEVLGAEISAVKKGERGIPGELRGNFKKDSTIGAVESNTECGIYGRALNFTSNGEPMPVASRNEIQEGKAQIMCCIDGETVDTYDVEIQKISHRKNAVTKCMVIKVTDPVLLEKTGGILQGMSGSPILQNGKIVGAVTHVFVNDPTRGYGIFIENMLAETEKIK